MIIIFFGFVISLFFLYFLGYIPNTLYYTRKRFINLAHHIKTEKDCKIITFEYYVLLGLAKELNVHYGVNITKDYYLSYVFRDVVNFVQRECSEALECQSLNFDDIKCDTEDLKTFQKYYLKNIPDDQHQNIEFHDIEKNNKKFVFPCSINVYTDFNVNGYMFDINNVKRDGMCKREIVGFIRK